MAKWVIITFFFTAHEFVCWGQDKVEQASRQMTANEAAQVTLLCNYSTSFSNAYLFWYKQLPNRSPTFILSEFTIGKGTIENAFKERFSATLDSTSRTVPLMIKNLHVSDSAVYYYNKRNKSSGRHITEDKITKHTSVHRSAQSFRVSTELE
uniref:Ig-like domain-containing protein n=1 Tax=Sinocyclocheilus anshuiensis TaxID=1608454 RepID=A0A671Q251_9TELE